MKKIIALILTLILTFSLSAAAFAATGDSDVTVAVNSTNISVTLPLDITVTALVDGGSAEVPSNYQIVNSSAIPVKVDTIAVALSNSTDWAFKDTPCVAGDTPATTDVNDIYLSVNGLVLSVHGAAEPTNAKEATLPWNIAAGATKNLPLVCSTSKLDTTDTATDLITITYVVSAGSYTTTP